MKIILLPLFLSLWFVGSAQQSKPAGTEMNGDTLYTGTGIKIYAGQQLMVGQPKGSSGRYRSIISRKAALVPAVWGQQSPTGHAIENNVGSKKDKVLMKLLIPGTKVTIQSIRLSKTGKPHFYLALLSTEAGVYQCDINFALEIEELIL